MCPTKFPDRLVVAERIARLIEHVPVGGSFEVDASDPLCDVLEFLVPEILRSKHGEWQDESIDGFFFCLAERVGELSAKMVGTCILISDQTVTPIELTVALANESKVGEFRVRIGESGDGRLGISGPIVNSPDAEKLLCGLDARIGDLVWRYDVVESLR